MRWERDSLASYAYVDVNGRICGRVWRTFSGPWRASFEKEMLGEYVGQDNAMKAVEGAYTSLIPEPR